MRLFFTEIELPYSISLCEKLSQKGIEISHAVTFYGKHAQYALNNNLAFKSTSQIDAHHLFLSDTLVKKYDRYFSSLSIDLINYFNEIERDFYILTDRQNHCSLSFRERKIYFRNLIRFWHGYLSNDKPDLVYFTYTPHVCWQIVLMHMCKYLNIRYTYLSHTAINNRSILKTDYTSVEKVPTDYLLEDKKEDIIKTIPQDLWEDFSTESIATNVVKAQNDAFHKQLGLNAHKSDIEKDISFNQKKELKSNIRTRLAKIINLLKNKKNFHLPVAMDNKKSNILWRNYGLKHERYAKELKDFYEQHTSEINYDQPYIYFPMHLQPELTSQPEALVFEDHLLSLEIILAALPENWLVYVKENPRQHDTTLNKVSAMHFRDCNDYRAMLSDKRVRFVPQSEKSQTLIENAKLTITLTGTAGWEALNMGKPCAVFGYPWYSACNCCFTIQNSNDLKNILKQVTILQKNDVEEALLKYISYYKDKLFIGTLSSPSDVSYNTKAYDKLIENHVNAIMLFFSQNNK